MGKALPLGYKMGEARARVPPLINSYSDYLKEKYSRGAYRVSVDAGFSCPHRGPDRDRPGCSYCDEWGSRAPYLGDETEVRRQVQTGIRFLERRYGAELFLLYFQAFTNTFAPAGELKRLYDFALGLAPFKELIVSTRPDCVSEETADLLADYKRPDFDVWVELGLQSSIDRTLELINRGHGSGEFYAAYGRLKQRKIRVAVHLIFGLPGEGWGIKIHNLHVPLGTKLLREVREGEVTVPTSRRHLDYTIMALERLPGQTVVMRVTSDCPAERLALPRHSWDKARFYRFLKTEMARRGAWQGRLFPPS
jgi:radical SAM protein (TIGR01212 family)